MIPKSLKRLLQYCLGFGLNHVPFLCDDPRKGAGMPGMFRVLTLHGIGDEASLDRLLCHLVETCRVITPHEAEAWIEGKAVRESSGLVPYLVTFDDGFRCHGQSVRKLLARYGIKAVFFICPEIMDLSVESQASATARFVFDPPIHEEAVTQDRLPLTWDEARALLKDGHTIGSHTCVHKRLFNLDDETLSHQLRDSASMIERRLGISPDWFAFPFGDIFSIDVRSLSQARKQYRYCCSNIPAVNLPETARRILFRMGVDLKSPFVFQRMVLAGGFDLRSARSAQEMRELARLSDSDVRD